MLNQKPGTLLIGADAQAPLCPEAQDSLHDLAVMVTSLPPAGIVLKSDGRHFESVYRMGLIRLQQAQFAEAFSSGCGAGEQTTFIQTTARRAGPIFSESSQRP